MARGQQRGRGGQGRPAGRRRRAGFVGAPEPEDGRRDKVDVRGFVGAPEPEAGRRDDVGVPGFVSSGRGGWSTWAGRAGRGGRPSGCGRVVALTCSVARTTHASLVK